MVKYAEFGQIFKVGWGMMELICAVNRNGDCWLLRVLNKLVNYQRI